MKIEKGPVSATRGVRDARQVYLDENGFTVEAYDQPWTEVSFLGIRLRVPNTARHRFAIMLHDLHHVATGYGTDLAGEGEISAWELRAVRTLGLYVGGIVTLGTLLGLVAAPRRTLAAFRAGKHSTPLFGRVIGEDAYAVLLAGDVAALRERVGVPRHGLAARHRVHAYAPDRAQTAAKETG